MQNLKKKKKDRKDLMIVPNNVGFANIQKNAMFVYCKMANGYGLQILKNLLKKQKLRNLQDDYRKWEDEQSRRSQIDKLRKQIKEIQDELKEDERKHDKNR